MLHKDITVSNYARYWLDKTKRPNLLPKLINTLESTIEHYIDPYIGNIPITSLSAAIIETSVFQKMSEKRLSIGSMKKVISTLKQMLSLAAKEHHISCNPMAQVTLPETKAPSKKEIDWFSDEEVRRLVAVCTATGFNGEPNFQVSYGVLLLLYTGLKDCELYALRWQDIDFHQGTISVRGKLEQVVERDDFSKKYILTLRDYPEKKHRDIPISDNAREILLLIQNGSNVSKEDFVIVSKKNHMMGPSNFLRGFHRILENAGIEPCGTSILQNTYIRYRLLNGESLAKLAYQLGFCNLSFLCRFDAQLNGEKQGMLSGRLL